MAGNDKIKLSDKEVEDLRKKAREEAEENAKKLAKDRTFKEFLAEENAKVNEDPNEDEVTFRLELPPCQKGCIILDGIKFWDNEIYTVKRSKYDTIIDIVECGLNHQAEIDGKPRKFYARKSPMNVNAGGLQTNYAPQQHKITTTKMLKENTHNA